MNVLTLTATLGDKFDTVFYGFDMWVYSLFGSIQCGFMNVLAKIFTSFGDENFIIPVALLAIILCLFKKTRKYGLALGLSIAIGTAVTNIVLKPMVLRIRPYNTLQGNAEYFGWYKFAGMLSEADYSFPSGHTTGAFEIAVASMLCLREAGYKKTSFIPPVIAFGTMCSRIYLMVHYPSDVVAGFIAGTLSGVIAFFLAKLILVIVEKNKVLSNLNDSIDLEKLFKNRKVKKKTVSTAIVISLFAFFLFSFVPACFEGGEKAVRCAYSGNDYKCYNEAKVDDEDYPPIDGKCYCKIHWKQLSGEE